MHARLSLIGVVCSLMKAESAIQAIKTINSMKLKA